MIYVTVPGDTVSSISRQSGVPVWKIIYDNQLGEEGELTVGQALLLLKPQESAEIREDLYVTGYAYPFSSTTFSRLVITFSRTDSSSTRVWIS